MRRRRALAAIGSMTMAAPPGCLNTLRGAATTGSPRSIELEPESNPDPLRFETEVLVADLDGDEPPRIRLSITNDAAETKSISGGNQPVFGANMSRDPPQRLTLGGDPDAETVFRSEEGCWMVEPPVLRTDAMWTTRFEPDESESIELEVYAIGQTEDWPDEHTEEAYEDVEDLPFEGFEGCPASDEYYFEQTYTIGDPADDTHPTWGFRLSFQ